MIRAAAIGSAIEASGGLLDLRTACGPGMADYGVAVAGLGITPALDTVWQRLNTAERAFGMADEAKRKRAFAAGRLLSRHLMIQLGEAPRPIPMSPEHVPVWPEGLTGSISHTPDICIAAMGTTATLRGIGVEIRARDPIGDERWDLMAGEEERDRWRHHRQTLVAAKDACLEALFAATGRRLQPRDMQIFAMPDETGFRVNVVQESGKMSSAMGVGYFCETDRHVMASWLVPAARPCAKPSAKFKRPG